MKRFIALTIVLSILTGCSVKPVVAPTSADVTTANVITTTAPAEVPTATSTESTSVAPTGSITPSDYNSQLKSSMNTELTNLLDSSLYSIDTIDVCNVSKEYLEEVAAYSQSTLYFGYSLDDLNEKFGDAKYIFTLGEDGTTSVKVIDVLDSESAKLIPEVVSDGLVTIIKIAIVIEETAEVVEILCSFVPENNDYYLHAKAVSLIAHEVVRLIDIDGLEKLSESTTWNELFDSSVKLFVSTSRKMIS